MIDVEEGFVPDLSGRQFKLNRSGEVVEVDEPVSVGVSEEVNGADPGNGGRGFDFGDIGVEHLVVDQEA